MARNAFEKGVATFTELSDDPEGAQHQQYNYDDAGLILILALALALSLTLSLTLTCEGGNKDQGLWCTHSVA